MTNRAHKTRPAVSPYPHPARARIAGYPWRVTHVDGCSASLQRPAGVDGKYRLAEETPDDQGHGDQHRSTHKDDVATALHALSVRVVAHGEPGYT